ncbi:MAG: DegT/DnrJ/EryC1/StrS family aminotransferase [Alphaproteobacteria bacterium]|nr:DegT/DnrJ/EryC1/StrS family aminotransferase [Alphaproteobacteria bacterium]
MALRIERSPILSHLTFGSGAASACYPFDAPNLSVWHSGQTAIWQGIRALGLKPADRVLVPAYCCGSEVDALLKADLRLDYFRVRPDLSPDFDHLEKLCREPARALLVIHYFGLSQPMDELLAFAGERGLLLIEDNAHGLYSNDQNGRPLGSLGDIGVFSFTKTLPVPDGGALVLRSPTAHMMDTTPATRPPLGPTVGSFTDLVRRSALQWFPAGASVARRAKRLVRPSGPDQNADAGPPNRAPVSADIEYYLLDTDKASRRMSWLGRFILRHTDHDAVREARRRNFAFIAGQFEPGKRARPLIEELPSGCSPWQYPVWADDPVGLLGHLWADGIESEIFWEFTHPAVPIGQFEFEDGLKRHCIDIPVHQSLDENDMALIAQSLNAWNIKNT